MTEVTDKVVRHLLFHRALVGDEEDGAEIARYVAMVEEIARGRPLVGQDPLGRALAGAFELVLEERMNPWDIDVTQFARLYLEKVRRERAVHFSSAGRLVLMAWSLLKLQSDEALRALESLDVEEEPFFADWNLENIHGSSGDDFTAALLGFQGFPLRGALRRAHGRPVTLMDLVRALREAEEEARMRAQRSSRTREPDAPIEGVEDGVHGEEILEDVARAWMLLGGFGTDSITLNDIWPRRRGEAVSLFISILFLASLGKVEVKQEDPPRGAIVITLLARPDMGELEGLPVMAPSEA